MKSTFPQLLLMHATRRSTAAALRVKEHGIWKTLTWGDLATLVRHLALGLAASGLRRGQHIVIVGENRPRLYAAMLAAQALGAVPVQLYHDAASSELIVPINNSDTAFAVVEDQAQVDKLLEIRGQCSLLVQIWYDEPRGMRKYKEPGLSSMDALLESGRMFEQTNSEYFVRALNLGRPSDDAAMFYTSGTTGSPKGVVHTHLSLLDRARAGADFDKLTEREEVLAYLPPAWIGQNIFSFAQWLACGYVVNCPEAASTVEIDLRDIGPTYYFAPPSVFEGLLTSVTMRMEDAGALKKRAFHFFIEVAKRVRSQKMSGAAVSVLDRLMYLVGDLVIYGPLRNSLGLSRVRVAYTAGEAIGPDLFGFYRSIGVNLKQLYGSTETAVFVCLQPDHEVNADTVGRPAPGVELKITADGEILIRSPGLLKKYHKNPVATGEVKTVDGWYRSGDAGYVDPQGHLRIIDRIQDVGRFQGGTNDAAIFAPKFVENKLKFFPYIKEAVAFGNGRAMATAFINIDMDAVGSWAERQSIPYAGYADLAAKDQVLQLIRQCVEQANLELAADEDLGSSQIHRFIVLPKPLDADDGELTRTRKVRRGYIAEKYAVLIDAMYDGVRSARLRTPVQFEGGRSSESLANITIVDAKTHPILKRAA